MLHPKNKVLGLICFCLIVLFYTSCTDTKDSEKRKSKPDKAAVSVSIPWSELNLAKDSAALLIAARSLMAADTNVAMITVDSLGRPRVRTVYAIIEEKTTNTISKQTRIWIMSRASTRKISQILLDPRVTLYFNDDATVKYASLMGVITLYTDPNDTEAAQFLNNNVDTEMIHYFWPAFPKDFALIKVRPQWIEYLSKENAHGDPKTWRPQAVVFSE